MDHAPHFYGIFIGLPWGGTGKTLYTFFGSSNPFVASLLAYFVRAGMSTNSAQSGTSNVDHPAGSQTTGDFFRHHCYTHLSFLTSASLILLFSITMYR